MSKRRIRGSEFLDEIFAKYEGNDYDALVEGYAPKHWVIKDFSLLKHDGRWHLFHILGQQGLICLSPDAETKVGHGSTADFVTWTTHDTVVPAIPGTWESHHIFAPFVFEWQQRFYMVYTGINRNIYECLGVAVSDDLFNWDRVSTPIIDPKDLPWADVDPTPNISERRLTHCRDPHVHIENGTLYLYYSAIEKETELPVVGVATSTDALNWKDAGIAYHGWDNTWSNVSLLESSCVHILDSGKYLLTFNTRGRVRYVIGDNPLDFNGLPYHDLMTDEGYVSLEVVARNPNRWLVAYFGGKAGCRMSLGTLDWDGETITGGKRIESREELAEFTI